MCFIVGPKQFCALAQSDCTHEAGSFSISLIPPKLFLASCMKVKGKQRCVFLTQHFAALTYLLGIKENVKVFSTHYLHSMKGASINNIISEYEDMACKK